MSTSNIRPEDRHGLTPGTFLSTISLCFFKVFSRTWRVLPNFKGKVRCAVAIRKLCGLENHHIHVQANLSSPCVYKANLDLHSWLQFLAYFNGEYESETVDFLLRCHNKNEGYFLDLGANIGLLSIPFAIATNEKNSSSMTHVYCIEAVDSNFTQMQKNISLNKLDKQVIPLKFGLGECIKTVDIQIEGNLKDGDGSGTANILADNSTHPSERVPLKLTTIDFLLEQSILPKNCALVKIDLDGYDLKAIQGAAALLEVTRPVIYGEFSAYCMNWHNQSHNDVEEYLNTFDYTAFYKNNSDWTFSNSPQGDGDLLLLPNEKISEFDWCLNDTAA